MERSVQHDVKLPLDSDSGALIMYSNAQYYNDALTGQAPAGIRCDINGATSFVPIDESNTDYANLMALAAEGKLIIAPANP